MIGVIDCEQCYHFAICKHKEKFKNFVKDDKVFDFIEISYGCAYFLQKECKSRKIPILAEVSCESCVHGLKGICSRAEKFCKAKNLVKDLTFNNRDLFKGIGMEIDCSYYEVRK